MTLSFPSVQCRNTKLCESRSSSESQAPILSSMATPLTCTIIVWFQKITMPTPQKVIGNSDGEGCLLTGITEGVGVGSTQKTSHGGGMDIYVFCSHPRFFFGGGAPRRNGVTDFFFCRTLVVLKSHKSSQEEGGAQPMHPPPRSPLPHRISGTQINCS